MNAILLKGVSNLFRARATKVEYFMARITL